MFKGKIKGVRVCNRCGNTWTHYCKKKLKNGIIKEFAQWHSDSKGGHICNGCYACTVLNPRNNARKLRYKGKRYFLGAPPRLGVCNMCRAIVGQIDAQTDRLCKQTNRHHVGEYHDNDKLKDTLEVCVPCHHKAELEKKSDHLFKKPCKNQYHLFKIAYHLFKILYYFLVYYFIILCL